jgi:xanthine dehydrogenase accessory factor
MSQLDFINSIEQLQKNQTPFVLITLVDEKGHAPQDVGAKAIVTHQGLYFGTVGGGKIEAKAILFAQNILNQTEPDPRHLKKWNLQTDVGMSCGGEVTLFFEGYFVSIKNVVIFGAGHVAQALCRVLLPLDFQITVIDPRPEWIEKLPASQNLVATLEPTPTNRVKSFPDDCFFVVMTQGHSTDLPILEALLKTKNPKYIGSIGSDVKALKIKKDLLALGVDPNQIEKLRCPIGIDIPSNNPHAIAISVGAQILQHCK